MSTRYEAEMERRQREEERQQQVAQQFLKQMADMFTQTRQDLSAQFMPRAETQARMDHMDEMVERIGTALEKLTTNVANYQENAPRIYAERAETKQEVAELRTEIEKLKTARETDIRHGYGSRIEDLRGQWQADAGIERDWRQGAFSRSTQVQSWVYAAGGILFASLISAIVYLSLR